MQLKEAHRETAQWQYSEDSDCEKKNWFWDLKKKFLPWNFEQETHGPWCFADMMACYERPSYYVSAVHTGNSDLKWLTKSQMLEYVTYYNKPELWSIKSTNEATQS